jgi:hypothetical protein
MDTMQKKSLDSSLTGIIEKKNELSTLSYDHKDYDKIEEELHDLEDQFMENYGDYMEEALESVHEKICPDNDVLLPIAYLAHKYSKVGQNPDGSPIYDVSPKEGVWVDVDKFPDKDTRLVLIPNPTRIVLVIEGKVKEVVWQEKK